MSTRHEVVVRGLDGSTLLGYLAALGLMKVLSEQDPGLMARWCLSEAYPYPVLLTLPEVSRAEIVDRLYAARGWWKEALDAMPEGFREQFASLGFSAESFREFASLSLSVGAGALASFAGAESSRLSKKGERRFDRNPFYFFSGQQDLRGALDGIASKVCREDIELLFDCLPGEMPPRDAKCLRFEPQEVEDHALRMLDPSSDKGSTNVPANHLAALALPLLAAWPGEWSGQALSNRPERKVRLLCWRLWPEPLSLDAACSLQRVCLSNKTSQGALFSARAVLAVRGQTYYRVLPAVQKS